MTTLPQSTLFLKVKLKICTLYSQTVYIFSISLFRQCQIGLVRIVTKSCWQQIFGWWMTWKRQMSTTQFIHWCVQGVGALWLLSEHRRSHGVQCGCTCSLQGGEKILGVIYLQGKFVSALPGTRSAPRRTRVNFRTFFAGRVRFGGLFYSFRPSYEGDD